MFVSHSITSLYKPRAVSDCCEQENVHGGKLLGGEYKTIEGDHNSYEKYLVLAKQDQKLPSRCRVNYQVKVHSKRITDLV